MYSIAVTDKNNNAPTLSFAPKHRRKLSENEWSRAFDDFLATYSAKYPHLLQDVISYGKFIKELMNKGMNWHLYDAQFRRDREKSLCKWTTIRIDLQISASYPTKQLLEKRQTTSKSASRYDSDTKVPLGYCFDYHTRGKFCSKKDCTYSHKCPICSKPHPLFRACEQHYSDKYQTSSFPRSSRRYDGRREPLAREKSRTKN